MDLLYSQINKMKTNVSGKGWFVRSTLYKKEETKKISTGHEITKEEVKVETPKVENTDHTSDSLNAKIEDIRKELRQYGCPIILFGETDKEAEIRLGKIKQDRAELDEKKNYRPEYNIYRPNPKMTQEEFDIGEPEIALANEKFYMESPYPPNEEHLPIIDTIKKGGYITPNYPRYEYNLTNKKTPQIKCETILIWIFNMMKLWKEDLEQYSKEQKLESDYRIKVGIFRQCKRYIKPLIRHLNEQNVTKEIIDSLYIVVCYCMHKDYSKAMEKYIELSIGTAPWPMGVTMVGIHEHSTTPKVAPSHMAHILNDETQRKYLQSIKRLISVGQSKFPTESHKYAV